MPIKNNNLSWKYQVSFALAGDFQRTRGSSQSQITESSMCKHQLFYINKILTNLKFQHKPKYHLSKILTYN